MSAVARTNRILGVTGVVVGTLLVGTAHAQSDAFRLAAKVPTGQAVLLSQGRVALAAPAAARVLLIDVMGATRVLAGNGSVGFSGDGGPAVAAQFDNPTAVAADMAGNLYVADTGNNRVRRISPSGQITTVAGDGEEGYGGDGGPAVDASFDSISGVAVDGQGNLFISDTGNNRVRKVDAQGIVTTVAGTGDPGFDGDGAVAAVARLNTPTGLTFDFSRNRLLIAETGSHSVRGLEPDGTLSLVAGSGRVGSSGDGGSATDARLAFPSGVGVDAAGIVYIADSGNHSIRRVKFGNIATMDQTIDTPIRLLVAATSLAAPASRISILAPAGGENWTVGSLHAISWRHNMGPAPRTFLVDLSRDGGLTWEPLAKVTTHATTGNYLWKVTKGSTATAILRIQASSSVYAVSSTFSIVQAE